MLDRRGKLDDSMIQSSWLEMKSILDKEMPVKNSRNRILILILFLIGVLSGGYWVSSNSNSNKMGNEESTNNLLVDSESHPDNINGELQPNDRTRVNEQLQKQEPSIAKKENSEGSKSQYTFSNDQTDVDKSTISPDHNKSETTLLKGALDDHVQDADKPDPEIYVESKQASQSDQPPSDKPSINGDISERSSIPATKDYIQLTALDINPHFISLPVALFTRESFLLDNKMEPVRRNEIRSGILLYIDSRILDYHSFNNEFGVGYDLNMGKFSIEFNTGYGIDQYSEDRGPVRSLGSRFTGDLITENKILATLNGTTLKKGNYLSLGNIVGFRVLDQIKLLGRFQYRIYSSGSSQDQEIVAAEEDISSPNQAGGNADSNYQLNISPENDLFLGVGLEYALTPKLSASAFYLFQMNDPFKVEIPSLGLKLSDQYTARRRELRIGFKFRF